MVSFRPCSRFCRFGLPALAVEKTDRCFAPLMMAWQPTGDDDGRSAVDLEIVSPDVKDSRVRAESANAASGVDGYSGSSRGRRSKAVTPPTHNGWVSDSAISLRHNRP